MSPQKPLLVWFAVLLCRSAEFETEPVVASLPPFGLVCCFNTVGDNLSLIDRDVGHLVFYQERIVQRAEFLKLIGGKVDGADYVPVACLLRNGYACAGYVNHTINEQYTDICILVNARMVDLREPNPSHRARGHSRFPAISSRNSSWGMMDKKIKDEEFLGEDHDPFQERFGKSIPLTAITFNEMAVVYPVARIGNLLRQANEETKPDSHAVPSFLDFENRSLVLKVLRTKLW